VKYADFPAPVGIQTMGLHIFYNNPPKDSFSIKFVTHKGKQASYFIA
jgi:hypothetical protein